MHRCLPALTLLTGAVFCLTTIVRAQNTPAPPAPGIAAQAPATQPPAEVSPLLDEPKSPSALFDAVVLMVDLERPGLARRYLETLMKQTLDDTTLLQIRDKHGPAIFLELAGDKRLQPESEVLLEQINAAFRRFAADPSRMDRLIADLSGDAEKREIAIIQLRSTGPVAVPRMLTVLQASTNASQRDEMVYALTRMGKQIIPALIGALDAPDPNVRTVAMDTLGWINDPGSTAWLWYPAFGPNQPLSVQDSAKKALARILRRDVRKVSEVSSFGAIAQLEKLARTHFRLEHEWALEEDGTVEFWSWDRAKNTLAAWRIAPETASLMTGSRFARQALAMSPERQDLQALYLAVRLAYDAHIAGWEKPLPTGPGTTHDLALQAGPETALMVLRHSLKNPNPAASLAALQLLGQIGDRGQLSSRNGEASPIVQALNYPDFRVQFAAASTVMQLDPDKSFRSASRVVSILSRAISDSGDRRGLVIDPNQDRALQMSGAFGEMGYLGETVGTGRAGFETAAARGDIDLIAVHAACIQWGLTQTIANLRADARTSGIPIIVYGPESMELEALKLADQFPLVSFALEGNESFKLTVRQFLSRLDTPPVTDAQREARVQAAGFWFGHIATSRRTDLFDITPAEEALFEAVNHPSISDSAVIALGAIPTGSAQQRLQELVISDARDPALRETAALQLAFHIQKHGVLISKAQVGELMQAHNNAQASELKTAVASVIGSFRPATSRVTELLQSLPDPELPDAGN